MYWRGARLLTLAILATVVINIAERPARAAEPLPEFTERYARPAATTPVSPTPPTPQQVLNPVQPILFGDFDANGDGVYDFIVAMPPDALTPLPHVEVRSGLDDTVLLNIPAAESTDFFGMTVARSAGDVNGDGFDDVLINTARPETAGSDTVVSFVDVYSGVNGSLLHHFYSRAAGDGFGLSACPAGDVNNDGFDDIIVGAPYSNASTGRVSVHSGVSGVTLYSFIGTQAGSSLGASVTGLGDVDGDGYADFAIAEPGQGAGMTAHVYLYSGFGGVLIHDLTGPSNEGFGRVISSMGDVNADGVAELAISAPTAFTGFDPPTNQTSKGRITYVSPTTGDTLISMSGQLGMFYGTSLRGSRWDWDEDGVGDLVIGESSMSDPADVALAHVYFVSAMTQQTIGDVALSELLVNGSPLQTDTNNDGVLDIDDVELIIGVMNTDTSTDRADINADGVVDSRDLMLVLADLGTRKKDAPLQPQYVFGILPGGACRNTAIALGVAGIVGYIGCGISAFFSGPIALGCFAYLNSQFLGPAALSVVGACIAG